MRLVPVPANTVPRNWHWMAQLLRPAVERSDRTLTEVREALSAGRGMDAWTIHVANVAMLLVVQVEQHDDRRIAFVLYIGGASRLRPKAWLKTAREIVSELETLARRAGCRELRFGGRHWPLPGYEHYSTEHPHWVRKVLTDG